MAQSRTTRVIADATIESLAAVRAAVSQVLDQWQVFDRRGDVLLVVDELMTNSSRYVGGNVVVDVSVEDEVLRVVFSDRDPDFRVSPSRPTTVRYGLRIVDASTDRWGVSLIGAPTARGKAVWAEFDLAPVHGDPTPDRGAEPATSAVAAQEAAAPTG